MSEAYEPIDLDWREHIVCESNFCAPRNAKSCANHRHLACMEEISVDEVFRGVAEMPAKNGAMP